MQPASLQVVCGTIMRPHAASKNLEDVQEGTQGYPWGRWRWRFTGEGGDGDTQKK